MALAVLVLLPSWYAGANLGFQWCVGRGVISRPWREIGEAAFAPMDAYVETNLPGATRIGTEKLRWRVDGLKAAMKAGP